MNLCSITVMICYLFSFNISIERVSSTAKSKKKNNAPSKGGNLIKNRTSIGFTKIYAFSCDQLYPGSVMNLVSNLKRLFILIFIQQKNKYGNLKVVLWQLFHRILF